MNLSLPHVAFSNIYSGASFYPLNYKSQIITWVSEPAAHPIWEVTGQSLRLEWLPSLVPKALGHTGQPRVRSPALGTQSCSYVHRFFPVASKYICWAPTVCEGHTVPLSPTYGIKRPCGAKVEKKVWSSSMWLGGRDVFANTVPFCLHLMTSSQLCCVRQTLLVLIT